MYAVIRADGRQRQVTTGDRVRLDISHVEVGQNVEITEVLMLRDGADTHVGAPVVANAAVRGRVVAQDRDRKIRVFTYKRRKGLKRTKGHRQQYAEVLIETITLDGRELARETEPVAEAPAPEPTRKARKPSKKAEDTASAETQINE